MRPIELPQGHLSPRQFDSVMAQFAGTQQMPANAQPNGSRVSRVNTQSDRVGRVTAQHISGEHVNVQWKPGDVTVEPTAGLRQRHDWTGQGEQPKTKKKYLKGL